MTDRRLRNLERQWQEAGTLEAEAAYLRAAARSGTLPAGLEPLVMFEHAAACLAATGELPRRVRRRAFLEHVIATYRRDDPPIAKAARRQLDRGGPGWASRHRPRRLLGELTAFGREPALRALAVPAKQLILLAPPFVVPAMVPIAGAIEAWLACPCAHHADALRSLLRARRLPEGAPSDGVDVCRAFARAIHPADGRWRRHLAPCLSRFDRLSERRLSKAIRRRLLPWALGRLEPIPA